MSALMEHAKNELRAAGYNIPENNEEEFIKVLSDDESDELNNMAVDSVLELLDVFSKQGHSGFSASYVREVFNKLAQYEPLSPLTGEDWEWVDRSDMSQEPTWQNKRCSRVFKREDGTAYDIYGKVFVDPNGSSYSSSDSLVDVEFPYTPETIVVHVDANGVPIDD